MFLPIDMVIYQVHFHIYVVCINIFTFTILYAGTEIRIHWNLYRTRNGSNSRRIPLISNLRTLDFNSSETRELQLRCR